MSLKEIQICRQGSMNSRTELLNLTFQELFRFSEMRNLITDDYNICDRINQLEHYLLLSCVVFENVRKFSAFITLTENEKQLQLFEW